MDRRHGGLPDADAPAQDLHHGRDAVCCATCARNNLSGTLLELIHRVDHGGNILAFCRSGQDDKAGPSLNVLYQIDSFSKDARALEHYINAYFAPRQLGQISFPQNGIILAINI